MKRATIPACPRSTWASRDGYLLSDAGNLDQRRGGNCYGETSTKPTSSQFLIGFIDKGRDAMASATRRSRLLDTEARAVRFGRCRVTTLSRVFGEIHKQEGRRRPSMSDDWDAWVLVGQGSRKYDVFVDCFHMSRKRCPPAWSSYSRTNPTAGRATKRSYGN